MIFTCEKQKLQENILITQKAITGKTPNPILEGIYINANNNQLTLIGSDIDVSIETTISANVIKPGSAVINSRIFGDIIRKLPDSEIRIEILENENNIVQISCEKSLIKVVYTISDDYPSIPVVDTEKEIEIPQNILKNMLKSTLFAVAIDETRPILQGLLFEIKNKKLNLVALDGYRLAIKSEYIDSDFDIELVIPGKTLSEVSRILEDSDDILKITFTSNHILFNMGNTKIISRLLDGKFISYNSLLPQEHKIGILINKPKFQECIERASLMAKETNSYLIKFKTNGDNLVITSNSQQGNVREEIEIDLQGENIEIAFNSKYLLDVLKNMDEEEIVLELTSSIAPCVIKGKNTDSYKYLVLPVRLMN